MTIYFRKKPIPFSLRFPKDRSSEFCKTKPIPRAESKIENPRVSHRPLERLRYGR